MPIRIMSFPIYGGKMKRRKKAFWERLKEFEFKKWYIAIFVIIAVAFRFWGEDTITMLQKKVPIVTDTEFSEEELTRYITTKQQYLSDQINIDPILAESYYLEDKLDKNIHEWFLVRGWRPKRFFYVENRIKTILSCLHNQERTLEEANRLDRKAAYLLRTSSEGGAVVDKSSEAASLNKKADDLRFYLKQEIRIAGISPQEEDIVRDFQSILEPLIER